MQVFGGRRNVQRPQKSINIRGLPELVLIGSGNRRAVKREEESVGKVRMRDG